METQQHRGPTAGGESRAAAQTSTPIHPPHCAPTATVSSHLVLIQEHVRDAVVNGVPPRAMRADEGTLRDVDLRMGERTGMGRERGAARVCGK